MQIVQALSQVSTELLNSWFWQLFVLFDQLQKITASAILKDDPQVVPRLIPVVKLEDVSILEIVEDSYLNQKFNAIEVRKTSDTLNNKSSSTNIITILTSLRTLRLLNFSTDFTATYSTVFFLRPYTH